MGLTRIPLTIVATANGARTEGVLVGVMADQLDALEAERKADPGYAIVSSADLLLVLDHVALSGGPIPDNAVARLRWEAEEVKRLADA